MPPKSNAWKFFEKRDQSFAKCKLCPKIIKTSGNTTNLKCHLKSFHRRVFESNDPVPVLSITAETLSIVPSTSTAAPSCTSTNRNERDLLSDKTPHQQNIKESFCDILSYKKGGHKNYSITQAILFMICKDYQPISIVENEGFRHLLETIAPLYPIPSRKTLTNLLETKYDIVSNLVKTEIAKLQSYSITTDIWTDSQQSRSFLGLTFHFLNSSNKITCFNMGVIQLYERHTSDYLVSELNELFAAWGIKKDSVTVAVSDGALNITKALETIFDKPRHLHCFAHQINLVANKGLTCNEELILLIKKMKEIVTWFKQSNNASDELRKAQEHNNVKKLIQEVPTRWNSTYYMIQRFLELGEIINQILYRYETAPLPITAREIVILNEVQSLLKPLEAATNEISGQSYTTISLVIPMIHNLTNALLCSSPEHDIGKALKSALMTEYEKRFFPAEKVYILSISTLLDPRFKKIYFRDPLNCAKAVQYIQDLIKTVNPNEQDKNIHSTVVTGIYILITVFHETNLIFFATDDIQDSSFNLWSDHQRLVQEKHVEEVDTSSLSEMALYLKTQVISLKENPLLWWDRNANTYPKLAQIAKKLLSAVATSVPAERLFSKAGQTVTQRRNRLKGKLLSALLFLQSIDKSLWDLEQ